MNEPAVRDYQLIKKVGQGGICAVWQARHPESPVNFALKILNPKHESALIALKNEYRFLKFYRHPGIVRVFDYIETPDTAVLAMEYLPGATLESDCGKLSFKRLEDVIVGILEIANFLNHCGFIYGDFKPQNFMIDEQGNLRLIDFNLIRPLAASSPTKSGTLGYIAPEVLTGQGISLASDIFALGVTIYELATGRLPYKITDTESAVKIMTEQAARPPDTGQASLDRLLSEMLALNPVARPADYIEISERLGLKQKLQARIKSHARYYLDAGPGPFSQRLVDDLLRRWGSAKPLAIVAGDTSEHAAILEQITSLLSLEASDAKLVVIRAELSSTKADDHSQRPSSPMGTQESLSTNEPEAAAIYLIDCQNKLTSEIIEGAATLCRHIGNRVTIVCLFAYDIKADQFNDSLEYIILRDLPARGRAYSNYFLKKSDIDESWLLTLESLAGDDIWVWREYLENSIARDQLRYCAEGWEAAGDLDSSFVPPGVAKSYLNSVASMTLEAQRLLEILAILGRLRTTDQILKDLYSHISEELLKQLEREGWLKIREDEYTFANDSRALTVYQHINADQKRQLHRQAAEYLAQNTPEDIEALARHMEGAENYAGAARYYWQAAQNSFSSFDYKKARALIIRAESALANINLDRESSKMAIDVFLTAGDLSKAIAEYAEAEKKYRKAVALAEKFEPGAVVAGAYRCLADIYRLQQKSTESIEYSKRALALYREETDRAHQAACLNNIGLALWTAGDFGGALTNFDQALKINMAIGDFGEQAKIYNNLAIIYDQTGRSADVIGNFEMALNCAEKLSDLRLQTKIYDNIGYFYLNSGNPRRALEYFKKDLELATRIGLDEDRINILSNMGLAYHKIGSIIQSAEVHQEALKISRALGHELLQAQTCHHLARDCMAMGNYTLALKMLEEAAEISRHLTGSELAMEILLTGAELHYVLNDLEGCRRFADGFDKPDNITFMQSLRAEYLKALLEVLSDPTVEDNAESAGQRIEDIFRRARQAVFLDLAGEASLKLAEMNRRAGRENSALKALVEFQNLQIENMLLRMAFELESAWLAYAGRQYDKAIELAGNAERMAIEAGCRPLLFEITLLGIRVYNECGKTALALKKFRKAEQLKNSLAEAYPPDIDKECFDGLPAMKEFRRFADIFRGSAFAEDSVAPKRKTA